MSISFSIQFFHPISIVQNKPRENMDEPRKFGETLRKKIWFETGEEGEGGGNGEVPKVSGNVTGYEARSRGNSMYGFRVAVTVPLKTTWAPCGVKDFLRLSLVPCAPCVRHLVSGRLPCAPRSPRAQPHFSKPRPLPEPWATKLRQKRLDFTPVILW